MADLNRIVVLAPNWLGDVVMALPALASLRAWSADAHLTVAARPSVAPLLTIAAGVDEVIALSSAGGWRGMGALGRDAARLREGRFDVAVVLPNSFHAALLTRMTGIAQRWGYRRDLRGRLLTRAVPRPRGAVHQAEYYLALIRALGGPDAPLVAELQVPDQLRQRAQALLQEHGWNGEPLLGLAPGAAFGLAKRYPPDRVAAAAAALARAHGAMPVAVGTHGDRDTISEVARLYAQATHGRSAPRFIDLAGRTDLRVLAGVLASCTAVIANDSGAMHVAAAVGVPVAGVFGPTDEHATAPLPHSSGVTVTAITGEAWCRPCQLRACPLDHLCMTSIDPARVVDVVRARFGHAPLMDGPL
jgi:heptosyltransferase-2